MAKNISLFPTLSRKKASELFTLPIPSFRYMRSGNLWPLVLNEPDASVTTLRDEKGYWTPDEYDLRLEWNFTYINAHKLYDSTDWEFACACHDAKIGIALSWFSSDSKRRYTEEIGVIENDMTLHSIKCVHCFDKAELRGEVGFAIILFIKEAGNPFDDESHFANQPGTIIGEVDTFSIKIDGNGSFFTVFEVNRPGSPLWDVEYSIDDPSSDSFSDCVSVCLNRAHKRFPLIKRDSGEFCQQLFNEIMSNAMVIIIEMVRAYEKDDNFDCLSEFEEGSVAHALSYFKDKLLWDFSTPITVSHSARLFVEKNMKDYESHRI